MLLECTKGLTEAITLTSELCERRRDVLVIGRLTLRFIVEAVQFMRSSIGVVNVRLEAIFAETFDSFLLFVRNLDKNLLIARYLLIDLLNFILLGVYFDL